ncbi:MAG: thiol peroxidase [Actinomycetota bacterium]
MATKRRTSTKKSKKKTAKRKQTKKSARKPSKKAVRATTHLGGNPVHTNASLPAPRTAAPAFTLVKDDLSEVTNQALKGKRVVLNIFPSIDTPTCQKSVRRFNELAAAMNNTVVLCVSADLPFAQKRFCGAEGITNVQNASTFRTNFGKVFGVSMVDGPLKGLLARAVVVIDEAGKVTHTELVNEIADEPNYDAALAALR